MNDRDLILQQLERIIEQRGGKRSQLSEIDVDYRNQYNEDESIGINYIDMLNDVTRKIAVRLNPKDSKGKDTTIDTVSPAMMRAVPQKAIDIVMKALSKDRDIAIKEQIRGDRLADKYLKEVETKRHLAVYKDNLKKAKVKLGDTSDSKRKAYEDLKYPGINTFATDYKDSGAKNIQLKINDALGKELLGFQGSGKKKPNAYNKFVKDYFKKHKGATMRDAAEAWRK